MTKKDARKWKIWYLITGVKNTETGKLKENLGKEKKEKRDLDPSPQEAETDHWVWDQPALQSECQASQGYREKPCLENQKQSKQLQQKEKKNMN